MQFPQNWYLLPLEDCMDRIIDYRGKTPKKVSAGIPLVTAKIVKGGRINFDGQLEFIAREDYKTWMRRGIPSSGDVVMTTEAPLGEIAQLGDRQIALAQRLITLSGKADVLNNTYLKYLMMSEYVQQQLRERASGTTVLGIKQSELRKVFLALPPLPIQRRIAQTLGRLDDKIELNRRINRMLEEMAQVLYKHWFVDFGPFQDGAFAESELGLIPEGWDAQSVYQSARYINGAAYKKFEPNEQQRGLPIIKIAELKNGVTNSTGFSDREMDEKFHIDDGEILFSWSGNPDTSLDIFTWTGGPALLNQHIFRVLAHQPREKYSVYFMLKHLLPTFAETARNKQTTGLGHVRPIHKNKYSKRSM